MKKVLFLLGMYYPKYSANGICTKNVVKELVQNGYSVTCICNGHSDKICYEKIEGVDIYYIQSRLYQQIANKAAMQKSEKTSAFLNKASLYVGKMQLLMNSVFWPYVSPLYMKQFYNKAVELHKKEHFDIVVSVYTPFEALYAGYQLKKKFSEIKFVPYYLDALAGGWGPSFFTRERIDFHTHKWEKKINMLSDMVISMASAQDYHISNEIEFPEKRVYLDVPVWVKNNEKTYIAEPKYAMFAGSLKGSVRDLSFLLEVFVQVTKKTGIKLLIVGACDNVHKYQNFIDKAGGKIEFLGQMAHEEVIELEKGASFLINIGGSNPNTIPSKIFEYMGFGKPVISTYSIDNEPSIEYLEEYGEVFFLDERKLKEDVIEEMVKFIMNYKPIKEKIKYEELFFKNTPRAFVETIEQL